MLERSTALALAIGLACLPSCWLSHGDDVPDDDPDDHDPDDSCGEGSGGADGPFWCCDPDSCPCACGPYWACTEDTTGAMRCWQMNPPLPDDGGASPWSCAYQGDDWIICTGKLDDHPFAGEWDDWNCIVRDDEVECSHPVEAEDLPDDPPDVEWDCWYEDDAEIRYCDSRGQVEETEWDCVLEADGRMVCENHDPERPDDGDWDCYAEGESDICYGDHFPDNDGPWDCQVNGDMAVCENPHGDRPSDNGGWDCAWGEDFIQCISAEPDDSCTCVPDTERYCDEPEFSNWGLQACDDRNGEPSWGSCRETSIPEGCEPGGEHARDYEWHYAGGYWDGQVSDPDGDGVIVMPPDYWFNPAAEDCAIRIGLCVQDMWDLDLDLDNQESAGSCPVPPDEC